MTLERTLASLLPMKGAFQECLVVCQEADAEELNLCERYGFKAVTTETNLGIQGGIAKAIESASHETVLFVENDWRYIHSELSVIVHITQTFIHEHLDIAKLFIHDGMTKKFKRYWHPKLPLKRRWPGVLRWQEAEACKAESLFLMETGSPDYEHLSRLGDHLWLTHSKYIKWSNNPFLINQRVFMDQILPFADKNPTRRRINGFPDLEMPLNCAANRWWWRKQNFKVAIARENLFTHERYDRPDGDEKWEVGTPILHLDTQDSQS